MIAKNEYIEYLLSTPFNYTCANMANHKPNLSNAIVSDFLLTIRFKPTYLWAIIKAYIDDSATASTIFDYRVQDKHYSFFTDLVKKQYFGNEHDTVKGIGLVNYDHSGGNDGDFWSIEYRIYYPDTDGNTKKDYLKARRILFDIWYASVANLKLINKDGLAFFTLLKSNRLVSVDLYIVYKHSDTLLFNEQI